MTKEFLVKKKDSREAAFEAVQAELAVYLLGNDNPSWKYLIKPEALYGKGGWRAYARIEWNKK
jgi:hypothetical protein